MNRRQFLKSVFATAAVSIVPAPAIEVLKDYTVEYVDYRALARKQLTKWWAKELDTATFNYLMQGDFHDTDTDK